MNKAEVKAMVGKTVTLTMNGKHLNGTWEVVIQGMVENNPKFTHHAKVLWKKPAMPDFGYGAKPADKEPTTHYVAIQSLSFKGMEELRKVGTPKKVAKKVEKKSAIAQKTQKVNLKELTGEQLVALAKAGLLTTK